MQFKANIPNILTLANLCCGCLAIVNVNRGELTYAAAFIAVAAIFDFLDGLLARALEAGSDIGEQLDSLADLISFGVVPPLAIHYLLITTGEDFIQQYPYVEYIPFSITVFSALRLAKFNVDTRQSSVFKGLPVPGNAIFWISIAFIVHQHFKPKEIMDIIVDDNFVNFLITAPLIFSLLMISEIKMFAMKFKHWKWEGNQVRYIFLISACILALLFHIKALPYMVIFYVFLSVINNFLEAPIE
ncbi:MAG: phosphatidylcholine/phosphatidylserine synthase [Flavobacteriales bacterium]